MPTTEGLEDVVAAHTRICDLDGQRGKLTYYGVDVHDLAAHSSFEETAYLLWHGTLPTRAQLEELSAELRANRALPGRLVDLMRLLPPSTPPMDVLRTAVSALSTTDPDLSDRSQQANLRRAVRLTALLPSIVAGWDHIRNGREPVDPLADGGHAENFLYMLKGERPDPYEAHVLDVALILHADHELNASTFSARVAASTLADMYAAVTAAIGTLSGPLHGGANEQVMRMFQRIGDVSRAQEYIRGMLERKERIMGFGHRVYRTEDPRGKHMDAFAVELSQRKGDMRWVEMSRAIESYVKEQKGLHANVDFYSATVYYLLGIPVDLDTPVFACSRVVGWTAHVMEQYANNRLIRPRGEYVGPKDVPYVPIEQREQAQVSQ
uniref:Citrate synthase n=1 Tax=Thermogemmatispora argillosa TaxID=2045280 RepID=A0A455T5K5_9CHLR|nr:citrate synthase 2 [Thermogemmatispora argillosa]